MASTGGLGHRSLPLGRIQRQDAVELTSKGDLISHDGTDASRVPVGADGQVLTARATAPDGVAWETPVTSTTLKGSIFSKYGPLGAPDAAGVYDFTLYDPARTLQQNLNAANISGVFAHDLTVVGAPAFGFCRATAGGLTTRRPAGASAQGGIFVTNQITNSAVSACGANSDLMRITGALTVEALISLASLTAANNDWFGLLAMTAAGETEATNTLYMLSINVGAGPTYTFRYLAEHDGGINIDAQTPFVAPAGLGPLHLGLTRTADGRVKFYVDGQAISALITPTDAGGGGVIVPTKGANPTQELLLTTSSQGTATMHWYAAKMTPACFTDEQMAESFRRSMFGHGSVLE